MKSPRQKMVARLQSYPMPVARAYLRCLNVSGETGRLRGTQELSRAVLELLQGFLQAVAPGLLKPGGLSGAAEALPQWGRPDKIRFLWSQATASVGAKLLPTLAPSEAFAFLADHLVAPPPADFLDALGVVARVPSSRADSFNIDGPSSGPSPPAWWDRYLEALLDHGISFLKNWRLVFIEKLELRGGFFQVQFTELTSPYPLPGHAQIPAGDSPLALHQVFLVGGENRWFSLHPFVLFDLLDLKWGEGQVPAASNFAAEDWRWPAADVLLLQACTEDRAQFYSYGWGQSICRNHLAHAIHNLLAGNETPEQVPWKAPAWGFCFIELVDTSSLNLALGYEAVDNIMHAMDQAAAILGSQVPTFKGFPQFFPLWYRQDMILLLIAYDEKMHYPEQVQVLAQEVLRRLILAGAGAAPLKATGFFNLTIDLNVIHKQTRPVLAPEALIIRSVEAARKMARDVRSSTGDPGREANLWMKQDHPLAGFSHWLEAPYTRVSQGVFAVISRQRQEREEFLLRWNPRHRIFNLVGGHIEPEDHGDPYAAMVRELQEELAMGPASYQLSPLFPDPLRTVEYSAAGSAWTYYILSFFRMDPSPGEEELPLVSSNEVVWATREEMEDGRLSDGRPVSRFPWTHLAERNIFSRGREPVCEADSLAPKP